MISSGLVVLYIAVYPFFQQGKVFIYPVICHGASLIPHVKDIISVSRLLIEDIAFFILFQMLCVRFDRVVIQLQRNFTMICREPVANGKPVKHINGWNQAIADPAPQLMEHGFVFWVVPRVFII